MQLSEKYGDVFSLRMGRKWLVVVNRLKTLKEALVIQGDSVADRPRIPLQDEMNHNQGRFLTHHVEFRAVSGQRVQGPPVVLEAVPRGQFKGWPFSYLYIIGPH